MARIALHLTGDNEADAVLSRGPLGAPDRHGAGPAGPDRESLLLAGRPAAALVVWGRSTRQPSPRWPSTSWPALQGAAGPAPLSRLDGRPGARGLPRRRRRVRQQGRRHMEGHQERRRAARPAEGPAGIRRPEGEDLRRPAREAARRPPGGLAKATTPYGKDDSSSRSPTSPSAESLAKVRANKKALKAKAKAKAAAGGHSRPRPLPAPPLPVHSGPARPGRIPADCIAGGVDVVQLREKGLEASRWWPGPSSRRPRAEPTACRSC